MTTHKGGRPKKEEEKKRKKRPSVNLTAEEYHAIQKRSARAGKSVSDFFKESAFNAEIIEPDKGVGKILKELHTLRELISTLVNNDNIKIIEDINSVLANITYENQQRLRREMIMEVRKIGVNVNQIAKRLNAAKEYAYDDNVAENLKICNAIFEKLENITSKISK